MQVTFINGFDDGTMRDVTLADGTTVGEFSQQFLDGVVNRATVRVDGQAATAETVLTAGARVSVAPKSLKGQHGG